MRLQQPQWWHKASFLRRFQPSKFPSFSPKATLRKFFDASAFKSNQNKHRYAQESHGAWASTASELSAFSQASLAGPGTRNDGHKGAGSHLYILIPGILGSSWLIWNHDIKWPFAVIQNVLQHHWHLALSLLCRHDSTWLLLATLHRLRCLGAEALKWRNALPIALQCSNPARHR